MIIVKMRFKFPMRAGASVLVGVALLIAACSRPGSTAGSSALKPIDPAALKTMVDRTAKELLIPGAVVLLRTPQGEFTVTYGTTLLGATTPPRPDTHFRIASNTKTMTAAVIVMLAQEGKLNFDDPVSKYVPGVPNGDKITIAELLKMRSGLYSYDDDPGFWAILDHDPTKVWSPADLQAAARAGTLKPDDCTSQNPSYATAAGGVISTANDLATWIQALVGGKVLNADYQRQWLDSVQLEDPSKPDGLKYGYGITQLRWGANTVHFHGGEMPGFNSFMGYDPASKMTLVVWTNLTVSLDGKVTANALMLKVLDQIYVVSPLPPWPSPIN